MEIKGNDIFIKEIASCLNNLVQVDSFLYDIFSCYDISEELKFKIRISLIEAVNNSIKHGNNFNDKKSVILSCVKLHNHLQFKIQDEGRGFSTSKIRYTSAKRTEPNGRGVYIIKNCCDNYLTLDNGRITTLEFELDS